MKRIEIDDSSNSVKLYDDKILIKQCRFSHISSYIVDGSMDLFPEDDGIAVVYNEGIYHCLFIMNDQLHDFTVNNTKENLFIPSILWVLEIDEQKQTQKMRMFLTTKYPIEYDATLYHLPLPGVDNLGYVKNAFNLSKSNNWRQVCKDYKKAFDNIEFNGHIHPSFEEWKNESKNDNINVYDLNFTVPYSKLNDIVPRNEYKLEPEDIFKKIEELIMDAPNN